MQDYQNGFIMSMGFIHQKRLSLCPKELVAQQEPYKNHTIWIFCCCRIWSIQAYFSKS